MPPGVTAPYNRGGEPVRQVRTQRERDLEAITLAQRKGIMLGQLAGLAGDKRLHPESLPVVEWFEAEVRAARSAERLTELTELIPESGIRRRHWWQGEPAAIEGLDYDDADQGDGLGCDDDEPDYDENENYLRADGGHLPAMISPAAKGPLPDYSAELAIREWEFRPHGAGICGLIHMKPHGRDVPPQECLGRAGHLIAGGAVCDLCFYALNQPMRGRQS